MRKRAVEHTHVGVHPHDQELANLLLLQEVVDLLPSVRDPVYLMVDIDRGVLPGPYRLGLALPRIRPFIRVVDGQRRRRFGYIRFRRRRHIGRGLHTPARRRARIDVHCI